MSACNRSGSGDLIVQPPDLSGPGSKLVQLHRWMTKHTRWVGGSHVSPKSVLLSNEDFAAIRKERDELVCHPVLPDGTMMVFGMTVRASP